MYQVMSIIGWFTCPYGRSLSWTHSKFKVVRFVYKSRKDVHVGEESCARVQWSRRARELTQEHTCALAMKSTPPPSYSSCRRFVTDHLIKQECVTSHSEQPAIYHKILDAGCALIVLGQRTNYHFLVSRKSAPNFWNYSTRVTCWISRVGSI